MTGAERLLAACRGEPVDATPVWFMRQAGGSLPRYLALRQQYDVLHIARTPELCAEVTVGAAEVLETDGAILFADVMLPVAAMGVEMSLTAQGPLIERPIRTLADVERQLAFLDDPWLEFTVRNNSALLPPGTLGLTTAAYVDHLRSVAPRARTTYVDRATDVSGRHPFKEARLRILAPEEDTFGYYDGKPLNRLALDGAAADARPAPPGRRNPRPARPPSYASPPAGVDPALADVASAVRIPQPGAVESLNVSASAAICFFEQLRQRGLSR